MSEWGSDFLAFRIMTHPQRKIIVQYHSLYFIKNLAELLACDKIAPDLGGCIS